jgi:hypothetical protein
VSAPDAAAVEAAVRAEDASAVRELLAEATEADRRALAKALKPLLEGPKWELPEPIVFTSIEDGLAFMHSQMAAKMRGEEAEPAASERERQEWGQLSRTPAFAALAVGVAGGRAAAERALDECHGRDYRVSDAECAAIAGVLADRSPPWLAELVDTRLGGEGWHPGVGSWSLARWLVRLGAIERPAVPEYGARMVQSLTQDSPLSPPLEPGQSRFEPPGYDGPRRKMVGTGGVLLARAILDNPGLLQHEIWRLFTDPGVGQEMEDRRQVTSWDQLVVGEQWTDALLELAGRGHLDRDRLLDECLDAFLRDFPPNHVGWYASFHDRLGPSDDEVAARSARYLALLAARSKPGVSLGQRMCARLLDAEFAGAGRLDPEAFLAASGPALVFPQKSVATAQLKLIGKLASGRPEVRDSAVKDRALATAAQAFAHQREDVQAAALKLIARYGVPQDTSARAAVVELASALSPVLRPDAKALGLVPAPPTSSATAAPITSPAPAVSPVPGAAEEGLVAGGWSAAPVARVAGVEEGAELVLLLAQLMEDASDALAVERALAGAVRLSAVPLAERAEVAGPLLKRARKKGLGDFDGPFSGHAIRADMGWLTLTWGTGELPPVSFMEYMGWHPEGHDIPWQSRRPTILSGILSARIGEACTLIAAGRALQLLAEPEFADGTISPGELAARQALWAAAELTPCRYDLEAARLRAAPGADEELALEPSLTMPTVRFRDLPWGRERYTEDSDGVYARLARVPKSASAPHCWPLLTDLAHGLDDRQYAVHRAGVRLDEMIAAWHLLCPHDPELTAAHLLSPLSDGLGPGRNAAVTAVRGLATLAGAFGKICHLALVTGLSGASADVRIAAADAWTQVAVEGRLDPALAAEVIELGVTAGALKLSRIADGLGHAAPHPVASAGVAQACLTATAAFLPAKPAGLHLLLELAATASTVSGMPELPAPIAALARSKGTSKLAEAARRLARLG